MDPEPPLLDGVVSAPPWEDRLDSLVGTGPLGADRSRHEMTRERRDIDRRISRAVLPVRLVSHSPLQVRAAVSTGCQRIEVPNDRPESLRCPDLPVL